ncbi:MAG: zf-HC2 domain-containing protein [Deltaproteobacteria bacterium]|nr:zf-HC2 domain-containing protein [Deltaproteobacteria bacterium]
MTALDALTPLFSAHARAERLMDARLDADRGEGPLSPEDEAWLESHLASCPRCRGAFEDRSRLVQGLLREPPLMAPEGFADRVLARAQQEVTQRPAVALHEEPRHWGQWLMAGAAVAATVLFVALAGPGRGPTGAVEVGGAGGGAPVVREAADFEVRAPSVGAAEVRARVVRIADAHSGTVTAHDRVLVVRIPRAELVGVLQDLSRGGELAVTRKSTLAPEQETVVLEVALE